MRKGFCLLILFFLLIPKSGLSFSHPLSLCPGVLSSQIVDRTNDSSIIVNYDPESKYYVFLRCGDGVRDRSDNSPKTCHIYKEGHEGKLCREEIRNTRLGRIAGHGIDFGVATVTGGVSRFGRISRLVSAAREQRRPHACNGLSLMKLTAYGRNTQNLVQAHYQLHTEIAPMTTVLRLSTRNPRAQESVVFQQLDYFLYAVGRRVTDGTSRRIHHEGPAYMTANGTNQLVIDEGLKPELCSKITRNRQNTEPVSTTPSSTST